MAKVVLKINPDASKEVLDKIDGILDDTADNILAKSQELVPVDESTLKKSANIDRSYLHKIVRYVAPHADSVEFGTDPHMPPVQPLIEWAMRVLVVSKKDAEKIGWAIANKIKARGSPAKPYLRPAFDEGIRYLKEQLKKV